MKVSFYFYAISYFCYLIRISWIIIKISVIYERSISKFYKVCLLLSPLYLQQFLILPFLQSAVSCIACHDLRKPPSLRRCRWSTSGCSCIRPRSSAGLLQTDSSTSRIWKYFDKLDETILSCIHDMTGYYFSFCFNGVARLATFINFIKSAWCQFHQC